MSSRFAVTDVTVEEAPPEGDQNEGEPVVDKDTSDESKKMQYLTLDTVTQNELTVTSSISGNLALYETELQKRPRIAQLLSSLRPVDGIPENPSAAKGKKPKKKANLGTIMGVYLPTLQNILGVILFLRLSWIVGIAGVGQSFLLVAICCIATLLTAISMSAIATNGHVPAGGAYFMISRNLGPEFGGAVGILFYLATTFAASLYVVGAIEILLTYVVPQASIFGEIRGNPTVLFNNIRVYGTILLFLMVVIVFIGVKIVNWFATLCLVAVLIAVASIYAGAFNPVPRVNICTLDGVALQSPLSCNSADLAMARNITDNPDLYPDIANFSKLLNQTCFDGSPKLREAFNGSFFFAPTNTSFLDLDAGNWTSDVLPVCRFGIPGITASHLIVDNTPAHFLKEGEVRDGVDGVGLQITAEITTSFLVLIGIFFPSVTGIMAGSNRSGDLKDAQKSIPIGTIAAILTTSTIYLTCVLFFGGVIEGFLLRDQFGFAAGLTVALLSWPSQWVILIGALLSTIGAGLQSLTGAPRLLQAIANDNLISLLSFFKRTGLNGEPSFALILTAILAECGVLIASLDLVAPILTMFFLICYMFVNFACVLQSLLKAPNWRPRFKFYHWIPSLLGALLCLTLMFLVSWYYALVALVLAILIYKYIEYRGAEKEWGDGVTGLSLQAARYSLLRLEEGPVHTKNWRPQVLILCKLDQNLIPSHPKVLSLASQLKAGKGLSMVHSIIEGQYTHKVAECVAAKQSLKRFMDDNKIKGFCKVVATRNVMDGLSQIVQSAGLGGMKHNTVIISWPDSWRKSTTWNIFVECIRAASSSDLAVLVPKGINWFPSNEDRMKGNIDVWWVVHDGGLLMLLPFLLRQHKVWRHCHLRIFTVAQMEDNSIQMKKDLAAFLYQLRIPAEVDVIEMPDNDISAYTYERTLIMEQRNEMLKQMRLTTREKKGEVQHLLARSFSRKRLNVPLSPVAEISIPVPQLPPTQQTTAPPSSNNAMAPSKPQSSSSNTRKSSSHSLTKDKDTISIGELSTEPRVHGQGLTSSSMLAEDEQEEDEFLNFRAHSPPRGTPPPPSKTFQVDDFLNLRSSSPPRGASSKTLPSHRATPPRGTPPPRARKDSSSSDSSAPEEQSVRTPLLEQQEVAITTLPVNPLPSIQRYDQMFASEEDGIPLGGAADNLATQPHEENVRRMNTSVKLNELIVNRSHEASLVIINLPGPPNHSGDEENYMEFLDVLTEGLERVLMVRGGGREVITIYS